MRTWLKVKLEPLAGKTQQNAAVEAVVLANSSYGAAQPQLDRPRPSEPELRS